jgi:hypothetical protein
VVGGASVNENSSLEGVEDGQEKKAPRAVRRLLDPNDGNVTLTTLQRAAPIVGRFRLR